MQSRRDFLSATAAGAAGFLAAPALPMEPIKRTGKPTIKFSLAAYSLRDHLTAKKGEKPRLDLPGFIDYCAAQGLDGTELTSYYFPPSPTPAYLNEIKRRCQFAGLDISGGAIGNNFCLPPGAKLDEEFKKTAGWVRTYAALGVRVIRVFAGNVPKGEPESEYVGRCIENLEKACEDAGKHGVILALENHGGITAKADRMLEIVRGVKSPWFGVNFDSGNFRAEDPYAELAKIAPYAVNAQLKVDMHNPKGGGYPADFGNVAAILKDAGYSGWVALEYEAKEPPYDGIPKGLAKMRAAFA